MLLISMTASFAVHIVCHYGHVLRNITYRQQIRFLCMVSFWRDELLVYKHVLIILGLRTKTQGNVYNNSHVCVLHIYL
jgi:hypothetical protein